MAKYIVFDNEKPMISEKKYGLEDIPMEFHKINQDILRVFIDKRPKAESCFSDAVNFFIFSFILDIGTQIVGLSNMIWLTINVGIKLGIMVVWIAKFHTEEYIFDREENIFFKRVMIFNKIKKDFRCDLDEIKYISCERKNDYKIYLCSEKKKIPFYVTDDIEEILDYSKEISEFLGIRVINPRLSVKKFWKGEYLAKKCYKK